MNESTLEDKVAFLQLECALYRRFLAVRGIPLTNAAPVSATADSCPVGSDRFPLAEKLELCTVETNALREELEERKLSEELEMACTLAAIADCRQRAPAETARDLGALLKVLGLANTSSGVPLPASPPLPPLAAAKVHTAEHGGPSEGAASSTAGAEQGIQAQAEGAVSAPSQPAPLGGLPSARQLDKAELSGLQLERCLSSFLERHEAAAARLESRNALLQVCVVRACCRASVLKENNRKQQVTVLLLQAQLTAVETALAAKLASGSGEALRRVDFDQLRIERAQGEAQLAEASAATIALKAQVAQVQQRLADQHTWLARAGKEAWQLRRQISTREAHAAQQAEEAAKVLRECAALERDCKRLREQAEGKAQAADAAQQGGSTAGTAQPGAGGPAEAAACAACDGTPEGPTILEYMRLQNSCAKMRKRIADWRRKIEVAGGRRRALPG